MLLIRMHSAQQHHMRLRLAMSAGSLHESVLHSIHIIVSLLYSSPFSRYTRYKDIRDARTKQMADTNHCILTAVAALSKDSSIYEHFS